MNDIVNLQNINNILITEEDIQRLFKKYDIDININDINLYIKAFTHKSYITDGNNSVNNNAVQLMKESNENLEWYGDKVVKKIIGKYLRKRYYDQSEGFLTKLITKIENRKTLAKFARILELDTYIIISKYNEELNNRNSDKFLEDVFEAFFGALDEDQGEEICIKLINYLLENTIDYPGLLYIDTNFKDTIQRFYHQNGWGHLKEKLVDISSRTINNKIYYTVALLDFNNQEIDKAEEVTKKKAEQKVCMKGLLHFGLINEDQIVDEFD